MPSSAQAGGREQEESKGAAVYSGGGIDGSSWSSVMPSSVLLLLLVTLLLLLPVTAFFPRNRNSTKESALRSVALLLVMVALAVGAGDVYRVGYCVGCTWLTLRLALAGPAGSCDSSIDNDDANCRLPSIKQPHITRSDVDDGGIAPPPFRRLGIFFVRVIFLRL